MDRGGEPGSRHAGHPPPALTPADARCPSRHGPGRSLAAAAGLAVALVVAGGPRWMWECDMTTSSAVGSDVQEAAHAHSWRVGFVLVAVVGTLWHFVYDLSGRSWLVGLVAPVNESVWEHTKLVSIPILGWAAWSARHHRRGGMVGRSPAPLAAVAAALAGSVVMVLGFYAYVGVLGAHQLALDIALFLISVWVAVRTLDLLERVGPAVPARLGTVLVVGLLAAVALLTIAPPDLPVFQAP